MASIYSQRIAALPIAHGKWNTASASDTVATGLTAPLKAVFLTPAEAINETNKFFVADLGDQAGSPAAGSFLLKSYLDTDADAAPAAATGFDVDINWLAVGG